MCNVSACYVASADWLGPLACAGAVRVTSRSADWTSSPPKSPAPSYSGWRGQPLPSTDPCACPALTGSAARPLFIWGAGAGSRAPPARRLDDGIERRTPCPQDARELRTASRAGRSGSPAPRPQSFSSGPAPSYVGSGRRVYGHPRRAPARGAMFTLPFTPGPSIAVATATSGSGKPRRSRAFRRGERWGSNPRAVCRQRRSSEAGPSARSLPVERSTLAWRSSSNTGRLRLSASVISGRSRTARSTSR
jgi:hypothetical protein